MRDKPNAPWLNHPLWKGDEVQSCSPANGKGAPQSTKPTAANATSPFKIADVVSPEGLQLLRRIAVIVGPLAVLAFVGGLAACSWVAKDHHNSSKVTQTKGASYIPRARLEVPAYVNPAPGGAQHYSNQGSPGYARAQAYQPTTTWNGQSTPAKDYTPLPDYQQRPPGYSAATTTYQPYKSQAYPQTSGLEYDTYIARPTKKGYYEPKVIPYPTGKPVFVNGYSRRNGTYVAPYFRALPRR
jgi:hypothetical protein